jgi:hypothetical protein
MFLHGATLCLAPQMRRLADDAAERTGEMRLIAHAAAQRNFTQWGARREHESLGNFDASARDPYVSGHAEGALECATEVADADTHERREILDVDLRAKVGVDVRCKAPGPPGRKCPTPNSCCSLAVNAWSCWSRAWMPVEERYSASDMCFDSFAVAVPCAPRRLDELSRHR